MPELTKRHSVGLLTALVNPEWQGLSKELLDQGWSLRPESDVPAKFNKASIEVWEKEVAGAELRIFVGTINDMGQAAASLETMAFLDKCFPQAAILCGIAGSLKPNEVRKGDVVVGKQVHWRTQNKVEDCDSCNNCAECEKCQAKFKYRMKTHIVPQLSASARKKLSKSVANLQQVLDLGGANLHEGEIFTWDYVLSSERRATQVLSSDMAKALCVEMEAGGFLSAVQRFKDIRYAAGDESPILPGLIVRGISDYATLKDKSPKDRMTASRNAARVAIALAQDVLSAGGIASH